jgi:ribosomal protein L11 methylase PrmA
VPSILLRIEAASNDALVAEIWELGCVGTFEEVHGLRAFFPNGVHLKQVTEVFQEYVVERRRDEKEPNFNEFERNDCDPVLVGERFMVAPSWISLPTPPGRVRLTIDSTISFGTGRHESTQLALRAMERYLRPGSRVRYRLRLRNSVSGRDAPGCRPSV